MAPKKGDSKSAPKKGKSEEPKKAAKDDKKGGKEDKKGGKKAEDPKSKGKSKKPVSESEGSEEDVNSEDESEEEVAPKKADKGKGKAALKGASKAVAVKGPKSSKAAASDEDEEEEDPRKAQMKKGMGAMNLKKMGDVNLKGASKAMLGFAVEGQKKAVMPAKPQPSTAQLKGASKALTSLTGKASPFSMAKPAKPPEKAKPKRNLKSTSRLFLRLSKKKKPAAGNKPTLGASKLFAGLGGKSGDKKSGLSGFSLFGKKDAAKDTDKKTLNLSGLAGKGGKMAAEAKGMGGKFKGLFGKQKQEEGFKTKSKLLGKIAAATNWLTGRFLTMKGHGRLTGIKRGQKRLSFIRRDDKGRPSYYHNQSYDFDADEYEEDYYDDWRPRGFQRRPMHYDPYDPYDPYYPNDPYGEEFDDYYYDDEEWEDEYGFYDEEGTFIMKMNQYDPMNGGYGEFMGQYNDPMMGYVDQSAMYNPYQPSLYVDHAEIEPFYGQEPLTYAVPHPLTTEQFKVPRPQVRMFGQERLDVQTFPPPSQLTPSSAMLPPTSPAIALNNQDMMSDMQYEQPLLPPSSMLQQSQFLPPQTTHFPLSASPSQFPLAPMSPHMISPVYQPSFHPHEQQIYQMAPVAPPAMPPLMRSPVHSPVASPRPVRRSPFPSPHVSRRNKSVRSLAPNSQRASPRFSHRHMDFQAEMETEPHFSPRARRRDPVIRASVTGGPPMSPRERRRSPSPTSSPTQQRKGITGRAQPSLARGRRGNGLQRAPTQRAQSPLTSPLSSPRASFRKRAGRPPSPRLSFRQQPPPDAVPLPSTRPNMFKGRNQTSRLKHSSSPTHSSSQRRSPSLSDRPQSPPRAFRPASPHRPSSTSPSQITRRPLPTRASTRRLRGVGPNRPQVPMGAVKPSPANPYPNRRSRHGPPVTHVAPFRSSIHSGPTSPTAQIAGPPMLARSGSRPTGLVGPHQIGSAQGVFHRPVGRGQPLVRMTRNQSVQSRQSFRAPPPVPPVSPQLPLKHNGPISPQLSMRRLQSHPTSPIPARAASPMHQFSHPPSPLPFRSMSSQMFAQPIQQPQPILPMGSPGPLQSITQHGLTMVEQGQSSMLTNPLPTSQVMSAPLLPSPLSRSSSPLASASSLLGGALQNPYLQSNNTSSTPQQSISPLPEGQQIIPNEQVSQEVNPNVSLGQSNVSKQNTSVFSTAKTSPLLRNSNLFTNVLTPHR
ncbi:hypothetical protein WMY93_003173 [Mugilogobius chulae]|uniref:Uncharacterized protein n=1 Tax=Mugilogobius chulae TaxID=88201 RepID=A0AAW0Q5P9_9GOBI